MRFFATLLFSLSFFLSHAALPGEWVSTTSVRYYADFIDLHLHHTLFQLSQDDYTPVNLQLGYQELEQSPYQALLSDLENHRDDLMLNDWLYYDMIWQMADQIYGAEHPSQRDLLAWFLLSKSGYETLITYKEDQVFINIQSDDQIFDVPRFEVSGKKYVNVSAIHQKGVQMSSTVSLLPFFAPHEEKTFEFQLDHLPNLIAEPVESTITFQWKEKDIQLEVTSDRTIYKMMQHYPLFAEAQYMQTPLSHTLASSLLPQLKLMLKGKDERASLQFLAAFTRSAFSYKEDHAQFGKNKPMIADELFHYPYSDCEDRSALYASLVRELLGLPMLVIAYADHLSIAVATETNLGTPIHHNGKAYYICDPTGPSNSYKIGNPPAGYQSQGFEILAAL